MPEGRALASMIIPSILAQMVVLVYSLADTFYIGRTNNPYMVAASSIVLPAYNITISIAGLAGVGGGALVSRLLGVHQEEDASKVCMFCIYVSVGIAFVFGLTAFLGMPFMLTFLGADQDTMEFAKQYAMWVIVFGSIPTVLSGTLANLLRSVGASKTAGNGITFGGILNMILDPLFMFVLFPAGHEVIGAGAATFLSNVMVCAYYIITIYRQGLQSVISFFPKAGFPKKQQILSAFGVGMPTAISSFLYDLSAVVMNRLTGRYGPFALAAIGIVVKTDRLPLNVGSGICQGTMPLVAYNYAAGRRERTRKMILYAAGVGLAFAIVCVFLYEMFAGNILSIFISEPETVALGTGFLRIRCLATPLMFLSFFLMTIFQGMGDGRRALVIGGLRWGVFHIFAMMTLEKYFGMYGIVWAQFASDLMTVSLAVVLLVAKRNKSADNR